MRKDVSVVLGCAAATLAVVLIVGWPMQAVAKNPPESDRPEISKPILKVQDCEITLEGLQVTQGEDVQPMSRVLPAFSLYWSGNYQFDLKPGESRTLPVGCQAAFKAGPGRVTAGSGTTQPVQMGEFAVPGPIIPSEKLVEPTKLIPARK